MGYANTDIGAYILPIAAINNGTFTSAMSTNPATGYTIDRRSFDAGRGNSCQIVVVWNGTTTAAKTLNVNAYLQHSPTSTAWSNFSSTVQSAGEGVYTVTTTAASSQHGVFRRNVNLMTANRYIRVRANGWINSALSTLARFHGLLVFGGFDESAPTS